MMTVCTGIGNIVMVKNLRLDRPGSPRFMAFLTQITRYRVSRGHLVAFTAFDRNLLVVKKLYTFPVYIVMASATQSSRFNMVIAWNNMTGVAGVHQRIVIKFY